MQVGVGSAVVERDDRRSARAERRRGGTPGHPETGDDDARTLERDGEVVGVACH
ncbi:Uncharacterised protein [Mycobacteroides abscessus]|nr:Uncharacterised protein [Mycobacteroides abscessus]